MPAKKKKTAKSPSKSGAKKSSAKKSAKKRVSPIPSYYAHAPLMAALTVHDAAAALDFYARAFGGKERGGRMKDPAGKIMHSEIVIAGCTLMISDEMEGMGKSPKALGGSGVNLMLYSKDVDATFKKAVAAGATPVMEVADQFWGDRYGVVSDPFGIKWSLATHVADLTPKQMQAAMEAEMAKWSSQGAES